MYCLMGARQHVAHVTWIVSFNAYNNPVNYVLLLIPVL